MSARMKIKKKVKTKQATLRSAHERANQAQAHLQYTETQVISPKKGEGRGGWGVK